MPKHKTKAKSAWFADFDQNGDQLSEYCELIKEDQCKVRCIWCKKSFDVSNQGKGQVMQHSRQAAHKTAAAGVKGKLQGQRTFSILNSVSTSVSNTSNNNSIVLPVISSHPTLPGEKLSLSDQVTQTEALLALKGCESQWSYQSYDNLGEVLRKCDPNSPVFQKLQMKHTKASYIVAYGLGPHYHEKTLRDIRRAPAFTLGTDTTTTKLGGLSKHCDIWIRFWSEETNRVTDSYVDTHEFGREPADKQVAAIESTFEENHLNIANISMLSRDDPKLMKKVQRDLETAALKKGNPCCLEGPCYIHPAHTAFKKGQEMLVSILRCDVLSLLRKLYTYFKLSSARREDMSVMFDICDEINQFFLRLVDTRWLAAEPCIERVLKHWNSIKKYYLEFLPSSTEQTNKKAIKSEDYFAIVDYLKPGKDDITLAVLHFSLFMCKVNTPFLVNLQHQKPRIHQLYNLSTKLLIQFLSLVVKIEKIPKDGRKLADLNLKDKDILKTPALCDFGEGTSNVLKKMSKEKASKLQSAFQDTVVETAQYLQTHLPFKRTIIANLRFLCPSKRKDPMMSKLLHEAAKITKRFDENSLDLLKTQLVNYSLLSGNEIPTFDDKHDRLDDWFFQIFKKMKDEAGEEPEQFEKFIKIVLIFAHGNAFLERGFNTTKQLATVRESLSLRSVKGQKTCIDVTHKFGGTDKVPIVSSTLNSVKLSHMEYLSALKKEEEKRKEKEKDEKTKAEENRKRKEYEDKEKDWSVKVKKYEDDITKYKAVIEAEEKILEESMDSAAREKKQNLIQAHLITANTGRKSLKESRQKLWNQQEKLKNLVGKKPKQENEKE